MAEILSSVASALVKSLASLAIDELKFLKGVPEEIQRLRKRLERILPVLSAADSRRLQEEPVDVWVKQLREVVYDAEDVVEGCMLETKKSSLSLSTLGGLRRHKIGDKIRGINQRLDEILKDVDILRLIPADPSSSGVERRITNRETSPLVNPDLVGETIEEDATALVNMLVSSDGNQRRSTISVFAIVGMGGIGKTTLAQKIFNDERIKTHFHGVKPIWKCISQDFSDIDVLRAIITDLGGDPGEHTRKEILEPMLAEIVKGKRFFLLLDDVWDARVWEELLYTPLQHCSEGSRVLVTTRLDKDYEFHMEFVIHMWIAEGFLEMKGDMLMEELGRRYWEELLHRSLLQQRNEYNDRVCKVHDLLHSLARHLASDECLCLDKHELERRIIDFANKMADDVGESSSMSSEVTGN